MLAGYKQTNASAQKKKKKKVSKNPEIRSHRNELEQGSANFCKGPNNKYFKF